MTFSIKFDKVNRLSQDGPLYILRSQRLYFQKKCISFISADPEEMSHHVAFHLGIHCLSSEVPVLWFLVNRTMQNFLILCLIFFVNS